MDASFADIDNDGDQNLYSDEWRIGHSSPLRSGKSPAPENLTHLGHGRAPGSFSNLARQSKKKTDRRFAPYPSV